MEYSGRATDASPLMKTLTAHHYGWPFARSEEMLARHIFRAISIYYQTTQFIFRCSKTTVNPSDSTTRTSTLSPFGQLQPKFCLSTSA